MILLKRPLEGHRENGAFCALIHPCGFSDERTFLTKRGGSGFVLRREGIDPERLDPDKLDRIAETAST